MGHEFASSKYTAGQLNAIVKLLQKQGGEDGPERFLRGELTVTPAPGDTLWQTDAQKAGRCVTLRELLATAPKAEAAGERLQRYLDNPKTIPVGWEDKDVFFPETEFPITDSLRCVHCLYWRTDSGWATAVERLDIFVGVQAFVVVPPGGL